MREIISSRLWIGNARDARDVRRVHELGIRAVVDLAVDEVPAELTRDLVYCRFPLSDGVQDSPDVLVAAIETVESLIRKNVPLLVACSAGMSRSPAVTSAALARIRGANPDDVLIEITQNRPHDVAPSLWSAVKAIE